jgi:NCS1 family nucleobase:cation symporter-1
VLPNLPGFLNAAFPQAFPDVGGAFKTIYTYAWFVGLAIAAATYRVGMGIARPQAGARAAASGGRA